MISSKNWPVRISLWLKIGLKKGGNPKNQRSKLLLRRLSMKKDKSWNKKSIVFWEEKADQEREGTIEDLCRGRRSIDRLREKEDPEGSVRYSRSIILLETMGCKLFRLGMLRTTMEISTLLSRYWKLKRPSHLENSLSGKLNSREGMRQVRLSLLWILWNV